MVTPASRWSVDVYYSGYTTVQVEARDEAEAMEKGREEAQRRLGLAAILDPDGAMAQLVRGLEPWEACDTAEAIG
jgi:hypothetical protein